MIVVISIYGLVFLDYLEMPKNELGHYGSAVTTCISFHVYVQHSNSYLVY